MQLDNNSRYIGSSCKEQVRKYIALSRVDSIPGMQNYTCRDICD